MDEPRRPERGRTAMEDSLYDTVYCAVYNAMVAALQESQAPQTPVPQEPLQVALPPQIEALVTKYFSQKFLGGD